MRMDQKSICDLTFLSYVKIPLRTYNCKYADELAEGYQAFMDDERK